MIQQNDYKEVAFLLDSGRYVKLTQDIEFVNIEEVELLSPEVKEMFKGCLVTKSTVPMNSKDINQRGCTEYHIDVGKISKGITLIRLVLEKNKQ